MKFLIDSANIEDIKRLNRYIPLAGVTTNPSIIKKEGKIDFYNHMNDIRNEIGFNRSLHIQVVATNCEGILKDAEAILENIDDEVFIKIPVTVEGLKAIKNLKNNNINITATAVYTKFQAYLALESGADFIAPYFNRMENLNINPMDSLSSLAKLINHKNSETEILGASFKNISQVTTAFECGAQAATISVDIIDKALSNPSVLKASDSFSNDWESIYGKGSTIYKI